MRRILAINVLGEQINRWILYFVYWAVNLILLLTNNQLDNHTYVCAAFSSYYTTYSTQRLPSLTYLTFPRLQSVLDGMWIIRDCPILGRIK
jgi:hypothetical protein